MDWNGPLAHPIRSLMPTHYSISSCICRPPFPPWGAALARWTVSAPPDAGAGTPHVQYLDERALEMPSLAFAQATRESLRMAEMIQRMLAKVMTVFGANERGLMDDISEGDDYVDYLEHHWPRKKSARGWSFHTRGRAGGRPRNCRSLSGASSLARRGGEAEVVRQGHELLPGLIVQRDALALTLLLHHGLRLARVHDGRHPWGCRCALDVG